MSGPTPKPAALRQRTNKVATAATLPASPPKRRAPKLPPKEGGWQKQVVTWWREIWRSPMATEYLPSDVHGLYVLAELLDGFWVKPSHFRAAEIRLQGQNFGLSPLDRRRLQWEIEQPEDTTVRLPTAAKVTGQPSADPRRLLSVV